MATPEEPAVSGTPAAWPTVYGQQVLEDRVLATGVRLVETRYATERGDEDVSALWVNLSDPSLSFLPVLHWSVLAGPPETVSELADTAGALGGVNGDFFEPVTGSGSATDQDQPTHFLVVNGGLVSSGIHSDCGVLVYGPSHRMSIGQEAFSGDVVAGSDEEPLSAFNVLVEPDSGSQCNATSEPLGLVEVTSQWSTSRSPMDAVAECLCLFSR